MADDTLSVREIPAALAQFPRVSAPVEPPVDGPVPKAAPKSSSAQSNPGNLSNPLQPPVGGLHSVADPPQPRVTTNPITNSPSEHGPAPRERAPLQRELAGDAAQQGAAIGSHSTLVRDPSGITGSPVERVNGGTQMQQPTPSSPTTRDTFAALDADPGQPAAAWTHSSPRQVEAGYQDPSLGWVSVRADLTPGGLHASVVPNSPEAAQALGSHLSGLNAYLAEHHGGSITASLAAPEDRSSTPAQHGQSGSQSGSGRQNESSNQASSQAAEPPSSASSALWTGSAQNTEPAGFAPAHNGRISVLA